MSGDDESFDGFELFDEVAEPDQWDAIVRRAERDEVAAPVPTRRTPWVLVAAAGVLVLAGALVLGGRGEGGDITTMSTPETEATPPAPDATLPPPEAVKCGDDSSLAEIATLMAFTGGIPYDYRIAPDLETLVGRSRLVARATIDSIAADGRFTVLEVSGVHVLTGVLAAPLTRVAAPGRWTQERERIRFDGLDVMLFLHAAELVPGTNWIPDIQGIVIGCDEIAGTAELLEPLPTDADVSSIDSLAAAVLAVNHPPFPGLACTGDGSLAEITTLLLSGTADHEPRGSGDPASRIDQSDVVVAASLDSVSRDRDGWLVYGVSNVEVLAGDRGVAVGRLAVEAPDVPDPDPIAEEITLESVRVVAYLDADASAPGGWRPDVGGMLLAACDGGDAVAIIAGNPIAGADLSSGLEPHIAAVDYVVDRPPLGWVPPCTELQTSGAPPAADDPRLDTFGPLGAAPGLDIAYPSAHTEQATRLTAPVAQVTRVPGGVIVLLHPSTYDAFDASILAAVGHDGTIRWRRCLDDVETGQLLIAGSMVYVQTLADGDPSRWLAFDVATGSDAASAAIEGLAVDEVFDHYALLSSEGAGTTELGEVVLLDLASGDLTALSYPTVAQETESVDLGFTSSGRPAILWHSFDGAQSGRVVAVHDGQNWRTDRDSILASTGIEVFYDWQNDGWFGRNGMGEVAWRRPDLSNPNMELATRVSVDGVAMITVCVERVDGACVEYALVGLDAESGDSVWEIPGYGVVKAHGDGLALVWLEGDAESRHFMIDVQTGRTLDGAHEWAGLGIFDQGCCGDEWAFVRREGGVVFDSYYGGLRVWYPDGVTDGTVAVDLAG